MPGSATPALLALRKAGLPHEVHEYQLDDARARSEGRHAYGLEAAAALGVDPDRIFKTLVAVVDGRLTVAVVPVSAELDPKRLADAVGGRRAEMADAATAERATGYVVGGISPLGIRRQLPAVLDASALDHETVYVSAGRRGLQVELAPADLARLTSARVAAISRRCRRWASGGRPGRPGARGGVPGRPPAPISRVAGRGPQAGDPAGCVPLGGPKGPASAARRPGRGSIG